MSIRSAFTTLIALAALGCGRDTVAPTPAKRALAIVPSPLTMEFRGGVFFNVVDAADTSHVYTGDEVLVRSSDPWIAMIGPSNPSTIAPAPFAAGANYPGTVTVEALLRSDTTVRTRTTATVMPIRLLITGPSQILPDNVDDNVAVSASSTGAIGVRVTWSSSDTTVVAFHSVDRASAVIYGKRLGTATITAVDVDNKAQPGSIAVSVVPRVILPSDPATTTALSTRPTRLTATRATSTRNAVFLPSRNATMIAAGTNSVTYTSAPGFFGLDSVQYTVGRDTNLILVTVAPGPYSIVPIQFDGATLTASSLNDRDEVAGTIRVIDGQTRAFRWASGQVTVLDAAGPAAGLSINNLGDVAGTVGTQAVAWFAGTTRPTFLMPADTTQMRPVAINDNRRVLVVIDPENVFYSGNRTLLWSATHVDTVAALGCSPGLALTNHDQILWNNCRGSTRYWDMVPPPPVYTSSCNPQKYGLALNDSSFVVELGALTFRPAGQTLCLWRPSGRHTRFALESGRAVQTFVSLNDRGWVLLTQVGSGVSQGLLYAGGFASLEELFVGNDTAQWTITGFIKMNNRGTILATAIDKSTGQQTSVLLAPQVALSGHP